MKNFLTLNAVKMKKWIINDQNLIKGAKLRAFQTLNVKIDALKYLVILVLLCINLTFATYLQTYSD